MHLRNLILTTVLATGLSSTAPHAEPASDHVRFAPSSLFPGVGLLWKRPGFWSSRRNLRSGLAPHTLRENRSAVGLADGVTRGLSLERLGYGVAIARTQRPVRLRNSAAAGSAAPGVATRWLDGRVLGDPGAALSVTVTPRTPGPDLSVSLDADGKLNLTGQYSIARYDFLGRTTDRALQLGLAVEVDEQLSGVLGYSARSRSVNPMPGWHDEANRVARRSWVAGLALRF